MEKKTHFFKINKVINHDLEVKFVEFLEKIDKNNPPEFVYLLFDSPGGYQKSAVFISDEMIKSQLKFYGVAIGNVDSSAILIYLSCNAWFAYEKAQALLHRARADTHDVSRNQIKKIRRSENQIFRRIAERLSLSVQEIYFMANKNTVIETNTSIGRRFFLNLDKPSDK